MVNLFRGEHPAPPKSISATSFTGFAPAPEVLARLLAALKMLNDPLLLQYPYIAVSIDYEGRIDYRGGPTEAAVVESFINAGISHNRFIVRKNDKQLPAA